MREDYIKNIQRIKEQCMHAESFYIALKNTEFTVF